MSASETRRGGGEGHREVQDLLAWYVNGTLDADESARVAAHLEACADCRGELALWQGVRTLVCEETADAWQPSPRDLDGLIARATAAAADRSPAARLRSAADAWLAGLSVPTRWLLAGQAALAAALAVALLAQPGAPGPERFETLGSAPASAPADAVRIQVAFAPDATEAELRGLVLDTGGAIVAGPSRLGIYTLALPATAALDPALATLRASPRVRLAEPLR